MKRILGIIFLVPFLSFAQLEGKVVSIADGDTFTLVTVEKTQVKIRLYGIDCPEKGQPFSNVCIQYLSDLIFNKQVAIRKTGIDRYGRTLGIVYLDSLNVNEEMLKDGMAWHYKQYDKNKEWAEMEKRARSEKKGLWKDEKPIAPWETRADRRSGKKDSLE